MLYFSKVREVRFDVLCKCNYILGKNNVVRQYELQKKLLKQKMQTRTS